MAMSAMQFKEKVLDNLNCKVVVCGNDFSFARKKEGNIEFLKNNSNYQLKVVDDIYINNQKISSTHIRNLLESGSINEANKLLFAPFSITSNVVEGFKIGRTIGFKTANINVNNSCYLLKHGVYFRKIFIEGKAYKTMVNVGINPTINHDNDLKVEAHILDFNDDVYYKYVKLTFETYYRDEQRFDKLEELKKQLQIDLSNLRSYE
jgi:riboflavin kinase/FMN adenylyltransferase